MFRSAQAVPSSPAWSVGKPDFHCYSPLFCNMFLFFVEILAYLSRYVHRGATPQV